MNWSEILRNLVTPEVVTLLLTLVLALLLKSKLLTEADVARAKRMLDSGRAEIEDTARKVTDVTKLTLPEVQAIAKDVKEQTAGGDSTRKKAQRAARAVLRGWLRF